MVRKVGLWLLWLGFMTYMLLAAPPVRPDTFQPLQTLLSGQIPAVNPVFLSLFSMVGIWLLIYSCLMFADGRMQKLPAWAFLAASLGTGVIGLIPYLALREPNQQFTGPKDLWLKWLDARSTGILLTVSTLILLAFAAIAGDWSGFAYEFRTNKFIHGMTLAFCLFALLFPTLLGDDMARRGWQNRRDIRAIALIPLFGAIAYLCLRPPLPDAAVTATRAPVAGSR